jgi:hypothetical protein
MSVALAGTPLPDPPFSNGGFVPPNSIVGKQEIAVLKILTKYAVNRTKCDQKAVIGLQLAYEPTNQGKVPGLQDAWTACVAKVGLQYTAGRDKQLLKGTPACLDQAGIDAIRDQIDGQFTLLDPQVYCDDGAAAPDPVTHLNIPDFKKEAAGEVSAAKVLVKAGTLASKCYGSAVVAALRNAGSLPPDILGKIEGCITKASTVGNAAMADLDQTQKLPDCLPLANAQGLVATVVGLGGQFTDLQYCASPSGAFVEGIDGL